MIVKYKNLFIWWAVSSAINIVLHALGFWSHPWNDTLAMSYGGLSLLVSYYFMVRLGILREKQYVEKNNG